MKLHLALPTLFTLALVVAPALVMKATAQTVQRQAQVYRCGPDGRDLRDSPCPGGAPAGAITFDDPSAADSRAARDRHLADARQAAALAAARRASEADARRQQALRLGLQPAAPAPAASTALAPPRPPKLARPHKPPHPATKASGPAPAGR